MDIKDILNFRGNVSTLVSETSGRSPLEKTVNVSTLAEVFGASDQPHTVTVVDLEKNPHLRISLEDNIILELDLISSVKKQVQSPDTRETSSSDSGQEDEMGPKKVQVATKGENEYEYEISIEKEDGMPVDIRQTEDTESSETNLFVSETESEELEEEEEEKEGVETPEDFNIFDISDSNNSNGRIAKEPEAGVERTTYTYKDLCDETTGIPLPSKEKFEVSREVVFFESSDSDSGDPRSETNRTSLADVDEPIADSKPKSFSDEDFIELLEKIKDLYECLREAEAMGKKHMDLIAELEKITASK